MADNPAPARPGLLARATAWALQRKPVRAFLLYQDHRGSQLADSVTYRTLFSVFAGVLLGFSLAALFLAGNPQAWAALIDSVDAAIPGLVGEGGVIDPSDIQAPTGLTIAWVLSLVALVGAAIGAIASLRAALRVLADKSQMDGFFVFSYLRNLALAAVLGALLVTAAVASLASTTFLDTLTSWLGIGRGDPLAEWGARLASIAIVFVLDAVVIAVLFAVLSGVKASPRSLWTGAVLGAVGLSVLQQLSGLFIGGMADNPVLASVGSIIALLLWLNLSAQVILIACSYVLVGMQEQADRARARFGASTLIQRRAQLAENQVIAATDELEDARAAVAEERENMKKIAAKKAEKAAAKKAEKAAAKKAAASTD